MLTPVSTVAYYPIATGLREHLSRRGVPPVDDLWLREAARVCPELRRAAPNASLGTPEDKIRLIVGLSATLAGTVGQDSVLVFDDAQWADPDSVAVLEDLVERFSQLRIAIAVVARDGDSLDSNGVADVIATAVRGGYLTEIVLQELPKDQVVALIRTSYPGIVAKVPATWLEEFATVIHEVLGGNPFYVLECAGLTLDGSGKFTAEPLAAVRFGAQDLVGESPGCPSRAFAVGSGRWRGGGRTQPRRAGPHARDGAMAARRTSRLARGAGRPELLAGEHDLARHALKHAQMLSRKLNAPYWLCRTLLATAELALGGGDWDEGSRLAAASIELAHRLQHPEFLANSYALAGRAKHGARGRWRRPHPRRPTRG